MFAACPGLHTLKLSSCAYLRADALAALLPHGAGSGPFGQEAAGASTACDLVAEGPLGCARLPSLTELDVSYCPLPTSSLADMLAGATRLKVRMSAMWRPGVSSGSFTLHRQPSLSVIRQLRVLRFWWQVLAINGCPGATAELWQRVATLSHALPHGKHALQILSAVGCKKMRACWLGMQPSAAPDWAAQV